MPAIEFYDLHIHESEAPFVGACQQPSGCCVDQQHCMGLSRACETATALALLACCPAESALALCTFQGMVWTFDGVLSWCTRRTLRIFVVLDGSHNLHQPLRDVGLCLYSLWAPIQTWFCCIITDIVSWSWWRRQRFMAADCQGESCVKALYSREWQFWCVEDFGSAVAGVQEENDADWLAKLPHKFFDAASVKPSFAAMQNGDGISSERNPHADHCVRIGY